MKKKQSFDRMATREEPATDTEKRARAGAAETPSRMLARFHQRRRGVFSPDPTEPSEVSADQLLLALRVYAEEQARLLQGVLDAQLAPAERRLVLLLAAFPTAPRRHWPRRWKLLFGESVQETTLKKYVHDVTDKLNMSRSAIALKFSTALGNTSTAWLFVLCAAYLAGRRGP